MMCPTSCIIAGAFIISSIFVCLRVDKQTLKDPLFNLLSEENKKRYINIASERKDIYLKGFGIGFIVSVIALLFLNNNKMFGLPCTENETGARRATYKFIIRYTMCSVKRIKGTIY